MSLAVDVRVGDRRQIVVTLIQKGSPQLDLTTADVVYLDMLPESGSATSYASTAGSPIFSIDSATQITITPPASFFPAAGKYKADLRAVYGSATYHAPSNPSDRIIFTAQAA